jgi:hypothetical protein
MALFQLALAIGVRWGTFAFGSRAVRDDGTLPTAYRFASAVTGVVLAIFAGVILTTRRAAALSRVQRPAASWPNPWSTTCLGDRRYGLAGRSCSRDSPDPPGSASDVGPGLRRPYQVTPKDANHTRKYVPVARIIKEYGSTDVPNIKAMVATNTITPAAGMCRPFTPPESRYPVAESRGQRHAHPPAPVSGGTSSGPRAVATSRRPRSPCPTSAANDAPRQGAPGPWLGVPLSPRAPRRPLGPSWTMWILQDPVRGARSPTHSPRPQPQARSSQLHRHESRDTVGRPLRP